MATAYGPMAAEGLVQALEATIVPLVEPGETAGVESVLPAQDLCGALWLPPKVDLGLQKKRHTLAE